MDPFDKAPKCTCPELEAAGQGDQPCPRTAWMEALEKSEEGKAIPVWEWLNQMLGGGWYIRQASDVVVTIEEKDGDKATSCAMTVRNKDGQKMHLAMIGDGLPSNPVIARTLTAELINVVRSGATQGSGITSGIVKGGIVTKGSIDDVLAAIREHLTAHRRHSNEETRLN